MSSLQFHKSRRTGDDPVKRAWAVWILRALKFNMAAAMNFFIPNVEEFFETILSLFNQSNAYLESRDGDQAEFLSRRLEQYEQTLRVMYQRPTETCPGQEAIRNDVEQLMNAPSQLLVRLESLYCNNNEESEYETNITGSNDGVSSFRQSGHVGRPSFEISGEQIQALTEGAWFTWTDVARILGLSTRTLSRRRQELGMPVGHASNLSQISDDGLDDLVRDILTLTPQSGIGLIRGALQSRGWRVQRHRIIAAVQRLDPVVSALRQTRQIIRRRIPLDC